MTQRQQSQTAINSELFSYAMPIMEQGWGFCGAALCFVQF